MINFNHIPKLLKRFGYSDNVSLGFCHFVGYTALSFKGDENQDTIHERLEKLPSVDINSEYEALLMPLKDLSILSVYDELVWRLRGEIEAKPLDVKGLKRPVFEFHFENKSVLFDDERQVNNLFDSEIFFQRGMELIGSELSEADYDPVQCFKVGICQANIED